MQMSQDFKWHHVAYWEHYKGGRYTLLDIVDSHHHTAYLEEDYQNPDVPADMQVLVLYQSLDEVGRPWARRAGYFYGNVEVNGKMVPRFRPVSWAEAYRKAHEGGELT